ncbi:hypothetical protein HK104_009422 [Borealophlyctis nickersoniae]|nr:hypothetical protein HK104_009422 [Borealophlyctis nickersoniae]
MLYASPSMRSLDSVNQFIDVVGASCVAPSSLLWEYGSMVERINFDSCAAREGIQAENGGDSGQKQVSSDNVILSRQSLLFNILLADSTSDIRLHAHPIFYHLASSCRHLHTIKEFGGPSMPGVWGSSTTATAPADVKVTNTILAQLLTSVHHILSSASAAGVPYTSLYHVATYLLDAFSGDSRPIWRRTGTGTTIITPSPILPTPTIRSARDTVIAKCKETLQALSSCTFLEAQYAAMSAQRLLDAYAATHFAALEAALKVDVGVVAGALRAAREAESGPTNVTADEGHASGVAGGKLVLEALRLIFHRALPTASISSHAQVADVHVGTHVNDHPPSTPVDHVLDRMLSPTYLRTAMSTFPPNAMNAETCEMLSRILDSFPSDQSGALLGLHLDRWMEWLRKVLVWQNAGREMEAVKRTLRNSMKRMDKFRGLQVRFYTIEVP